MEDREREPRRVIVFGVGAGYFYSDFQIFDSLEEANAATIENSTKVDAETG